MLKRFLIFLLILSGALVASVLHDVMSPPRGTLQWQADSAAPCPDDFLVLMTVIQPLADGSQPLLLASLAELRTGVVEQLGGAVPIPVTNLQLVSSLDPNFPTRLEALQVHRAAALQLRSQNLTVAANSANGVTRVALRADRPRGIFTYEYNFTSGQPTPLALWRTTPLGDAFTLASKAIAIALSITLLWLVVECVYLGRRFVRRRSGRRQLPSQLENFVKVTKEQLVSPESKGRSSL